MSNLDFKGLSSTLLSRWQEFLPNWSPGGKLIGSEYTAGTLRGGPGDSFKFNINSGLWADFASGEKGGDMISLYAATLGIKNGEAAKRLADTLNYSLSDTIYRAPAVIPENKNEFDIKIPPFGTEEPKMYHPEHGLPMQAWCYKDREGNQIFWEARYETPNGKLICPWSWSGKINKWVRSGFPAPRPIFGLDQLALRPNAPVVIVEGPKCAQAAQEIVGTYYVATTWNGGVNSVSKTDWAPLSGRNILIWPDADRKKANDETKAIKYGVQVGDFIPYRDQPGVKAAYEIANLLDPICNEVKILDVGLDSDRKDGWDAADAVQDGWNCREFLQWAKPIARKFVQATAIVTEIQPPNELVSKPFVAIAQSNVVVNTGDEEKIPQSISAIYEKYSIATNKSGIAHCNIDNVLRVLDKSPLIDKSVWFDTFHQKIYTSLDKIQREWTDRDTLELTKRLQREYGFTKISDNIVFQGLTLYAHDNPRNEPKDWMGSLAWDGASRVEEFFINYLGTKDTPYIRAASKNFWVGMVARIFNPGCKLDNMVVLEGAQGTMKSTALQRIAGKWFTETNESVSNKDFFLILQGNLLVEIAELHTFSKAEVTRIKQVITCRVDRYRAPYERLVSDHARQSVFVGSTNEDAYLKDTTGNRRFWPVKCGTIYPDAITKDRNQLFAEAVHLFKSGHTWWEMPKLETESEQEERRQADAWETMVYDWVKFNTNDFTTAEILKDCLSIDPGRMDKLVQQRMNNILKSMGYEIFKDGFNGTQRRVWRKTGTELPLSG